MSSPLVVRTEVLDLPDADLLDVLPLDDPVAWLRRGEGEVGPVVTGTADGAGEHPRRDEPALASHEHLAVSYTHLTLPTICSV